MSTVSSSRLSVTSPSLPKGGGAITGMGERLAAAGPTGMSGMSLPLPVTAGRGFAPPLSLSYSSGAGNGTFGLGWFCGSASVSRRTSNGTPQYNPVNSTLPQDEFLGPDGEVLVPERDADGTIVTTTTHSYGSVSLSASHTVIRFFPRVEGAFHRLEYWQDESGADFWLLHQNDGSLHMFGKTDAARIYDPAAPAHTAVWLLEESLSPEGGDIWYQYQAENSDGIPDAGGRDCVANRYLTQVHYGNQTASSQLFLWSTDTPSADQHWLFSLVLDYGERGTDPLAVPAFAAGATWPVRTDAFSRYEYGFEVRTWRLCQQVLMFHNFPDELGEDTTLVSRLLLEYRTDTSLSQLTAAQLLAYEADGTLQQTPPLELDYTAFSGTFDASGWQSLPDFPGLNDGQGYSLVDLYGEGLPGVLYRRGQDWYYRAPQRADSGGDDVSYGDWQPLPLTPAMQNARAQLMDIDGDGQLDWVVAQPGMAGFFPLHQDGSWGAFTPFTALPLEFFHPQSQLANLVGSGLADLALIGPKSVRLYASERDGFAAGLDVMQDDDVTLPVRGRDASTLVAFSDMAGSGQSHLVEVRYNQVRYWPSLGRGRFAAPVTLMLPENIDSEAQFNPDYLFLADIDGSGTTDLIYAQSDHVKLFFNQSGNSFSTPQTLPLPAGVSFDRLCQISLADTQGSGCAELVLTVPYMTPAHWRYPFVSQKPYLLNLVVNNLGASSQLSYRSSAQFWLDEKAQNPDAIPALPFPVPLLCQTTTTDELTGNVLSASNTYQQGVWDGQEQEFRGFGYLEVQDTNNEAQSGSDNTPLAAPLLTRNWYHCGREQDETALYGTPWAGDTLTPALNATRLTHYTGNDDETLGTVSDDTRWWLFRALKGSLLRCESWAMATEGEDAPAAPYSTAYNRYQVRLLQDGNVPVVLPFSLEQVSCHYEQQAQDPQINHQVQLQFDAWGTPLWQTRVAYPRRASFTPSPYPENLPPDAWASTYDEQQQVVRFSESRSSVWHLDSPDYSDTSSVPCWCLGLPAQMRGNLLTATTLPAGGISYETLSADNGPLSAAQPRNLQGQTEVVYQQSTPVSLPALVDYNRRAVLDATALAAYDSIDNLPALDANNIGYSAWQTVLDVDGVTPASLWAVESGFTTYDTVAAFYVPLTQQSTRLTGVVTFTWDPYHLEVASQTDALNNSVSMEYDYRFLQPWRMVDINGNTQEVQLNALGEVVNRSQYGTENGGAATGFAMVSDYPVSPALTVEAAISNALSGAVQQTAGISVADRFSWMGQVTQTQLSDDPQQAQTYWQQLLDARYITASGHLRHAGRQWVTHPHSNPKIPSVLAPLLADSGGEPVHSVSCVADNYPGVATQQVQVSLSYSDGFGRVLQQCSRVAPGEAWQRESDGEVNTTTVTADPRWAVSGRVEYDNKGQVVRSYQPYFINDWHYVVDSSLRTSGYSDTHYYDAAGREIRVITALGYLRRISYYPWFTVAEDENDTQGLTAGENI